MKTEGNENIFKKHDIKNTKQRNIVYNILKDSKAPITAEEIYLESSKYEINMSTVYRVLNKFIEKGLVEKDTIGLEDKSRYAIRDDHHHGHYLICESCSSITKLDYCPLKDEEDLIEEKSDFEIRSHRLELYGICKKCK